jgi:1,4-alpha-glucan branching enzyme
MPATLTPGKVELISGWIGTQRWYAGKGRTPALTRLRGFRLDDPDGEVGIEVVIVRDDSASPATTYQVPLTYRAEPLPGAEGALLGRMHHSILGTRWVYDGPHDPVYVAQLWRLMQNVVDAQSAAESDTLEPAFTGHGRADPSHRIAASRVLTGEQSNTSVICDVVDHDGSPALPSIVKIFRILSPGLNPDIVLQEALAAAGCTHVPATMGHVSGSWADAPDGPATGDLAFAQEYLPGTQDAWRVALAAIDANAAFSARAHALGATTATVHRLLAEALDTRVATSADRARLRASWADRHTAAEAEVPALRERRAAITERFDRGAAGPWPDLQRVHGDLHLGQVLDVPGRGWVLLDFEGEPLRPLAERTQPDLPLRDVAGMLRSFDYVAGSYHQDHPGADSAAVRAWAGDCRSAFLEGYREKGADPSAFADLLAALELDKALYEIVYEARNRPTWLDIPRSAIDRLTGETEGQTR